MLAQLRDLDPGADPEGTADSAKIGEGLDRVGVPAEPAQDVAAFAGDALLGPWIGQSIVARVGEWPASPARRPATEVRRPLRRPPRRVGDPGDLAGSVAA